jgi:hypothetical protein
LREASEPARRQGIGPHQRGQFADRHDSSIAKPDDPEEINQMIVGTLRRWGFMGQINDYLPSRLRSLGLE